jgi:peroxiredoxin
VQLDSLLPEDREASAQILALSVDAPEDLQRMVDRITPEGGRPPDFPFLWDEGHRVIDRYGLFNDGDPRGRQIAHPATFVIDRNGVVRWRFVETDYRVRPSNEDILAALAEIRREG